MVDLEFDAGDASALAKAVRAAAATLRGQGGSRSGAAESALADFAGSYADRFRDAVVIEAEDRGKLVGVLTDLASGIDRAVQRVEQEREHAREHAAWKVRESERQRSTADALAGPFSGAAVDVPLLVRMGPGRPRQHAGRLRPLRPAPRGEEGIRGP
ncbi:hypothetical protein [Curtobacterium sp. VKM Ac-1376]|uniref:hypothetical protein n=1 Tax=Curtobacterium sp. VKM Ac-1376 TaxID=123312 RepID=UPI00188D4C11|nr:hypothetical protein [Curtobacterium sp. VKM Ac-1376]MBF4613814.1 hypothetical protein [Curtobacterium sp. VKM Ac-1376]